MALKTFKEFIAAFRPEFGKREHIQILKDIHRIADLEKELTKRKTKPDGTSSLEEEIVRLKKQIIFTLGPK